jgi:hypothetical protein
VRPIGDTHTPGTKAYSPDIKRPNPFAPAMTHKRASHLILSTITKVGDSLLWKTLEFLSFQISQTVRSASEAMPFWWGDAPSAINDYHSFKGRPAHCLRLIPWMPSHFFKSSQIWAVKRHSTKRWLLWFRQQICHRGRGMAVCGRGWTRRSYPGWW